MNLIEKVPGQKPRGGNLMSLRKVLAVLTMVMTCLMMTVPALSEIEGRGFTAELGADAASAYIWRGISKSADAVIQPSLTIKIERPQITTKLWSSIDLSGDDVGELTEAHFTADYSMTYADFDLTVGGIYYTYPVEPEYALLMNQVDDTIEIFGRIEWLGGVEIVPSLAFYYDIDKANGVYGEVGFRYDFPKYGDIEYEVSVMLGYASSDWNNYYFEVAESAFTNFSIGGNMIWPIDEHVFVRPFFGYSVITDGAIQDKLVDESNLFVGCGMIIEF